MTRTSCPAHTAFCRVRHVHLLGYSRAIVCHANAQHCRLLALKRFLVPPSDSSKPQSLLQ